MASHQAGVTVIIVGLAKKGARAKLLINDTTARVVDVIGPYLLPGTAVIVKPRSAPLGGRKRVFLGNMAKDGGHLIFPRHFKQELLDLHGVPARFVRDFWGASEVLSGVPRCCLWIDDDALVDALENHFVRGQIDRVRKFRLDSKAASTQAKAGIAHRFVQFSAGGGTMAIIIPAITSENRPFLPVALSQDNAIIGHKCYALYDAPLWNLALIASRLHWVWIGTVCVRMRTDFSYSNTLGWNTFPVPPLSEQNKSDLTRCAEEILLARESHYPATIAKLYDPKHMPANLREAHEENDEVLERIYIGRRFRNDTERLEKLFEMYTKLTATEQQQASGRDRRGNG